jgi:hypothetical protein
MRIQRMLVLTLVLVPSLLFPAPAAASPPARSAVVLDWNATAVDTVRTAGKLQAEGELYMGYVQAAVYDAVTAIDRRYEQYRTSLVAPANASPDVAAAAAAHRVLVNYFPASQPALDKKYSSFIATYPDAGAAAAGAEVGEAAAAAIIGMRAGDVRSGTGGYAFGTPGPGVWTLPTPDNKATAPQTPWLRNITPFMLISPDQFRVEAPPALSSRAFLTQLDEVALYGGSASSLRTPEMSVIARFWTANVINQYNLALRGVAVQHSMDIERAARLLAMGNMVIADAAIACWDSKYAYSFWRPIQAVRVTEPTWTPFLAPTPNHPEYPSAHGCLTAAISHVFAIALGTRQIDVDIPGVNPVTLALDPAYTRHFQTVHDLTREIENARVWAGYHFRGSVVEGVDLGQAVARFDLQHNFRPVDMDTEPVD